MYRIVSYNIYMSSIRQKRRYLKLDDIISFFAIQKVSFFKIEYTSQNNYKAIERVGIHFHELFELLVGNMLR